MYRNRGQEARLGAPTGVATTPAKFYPSRSPASGTLHALTQLVGRSRSSAPSRKPKRKVPPAVGLRRRFPGAPAGMRPNEINSNFRPDASDASRRANFQRELDMNRKRNVGAPRRSAPRPPIY